MAKFSSTSAWKTWVTICWFFGAISIAILFREELVDWKRSLLILVPGMIYRFRHPVLPSQEVRWSKSDHRATLSAVATQEAPNVLLIVADDLGINDLGGGVGVETPNIDMIAKNGVNFANAYSAHATCAPSRAALFTGRNPASFGFEYTPIPIMLAKVISQLDSTPARPAFYYKDRVKDLPPMADMVVPLNVTTLPEVLRDQGYENYLIGKWHLGDSVKHTAKDRGFDETITFPAGLSSYFPLFHPDMVSASLSGTMAFMDEFLRTNMPYTVSFNNEAAFAPDEYLTDYLTHRACDLIISRTKKDRPFFLSLTYSAPHSPLQAKKEDYEALDYIEDHTQRVYAAMIKALDRGVGEVINTLKKVGKYENTLIIFTSDNGAAHYINIPQVNHPYRGWKGTFFEGGIRVPMFMQWPKVIPKSIESHDMVGHVDIFSTIVAAAKSSLTSYFNFQVEIIEAAVAVAEEHRNVEVVSSDAIHVLDKASGSGDILGHIGRSFESYFLPSMSTANVKTTPLAASVNSMKKKGESDGINLAGQDLLPFLFQRDDTMRQHVCTTFVSSHFANSTKKSVQINACLMSESRSVQASTGSVAHEYLFWRSDHYKALRWGMWKLQAANRPDRVWLFDLRNDPTEKHNLAVDVGLTVNSQLLRENNAELEGEEVMQTSTDIAKILKKMHKVLYHLDSQQGQPLWPAIIETAVPVDCNNFDHDHDLTQEYIYYVN